jgi:hypothetical protein
MNRAGKGSIAMAVALVALGGCGGHRAASVKGSTPTSAASTTSAAPTTTPTTAAAAASPSGPCAGQGPRAIRHVVEIWMENKSYSEVIGSSSAPYETTLARACATLTHMAVNGSPSEPNYLAATAGTTFGVTDDGRHPQTADNIFRQVRAAGLTAREFHDGATACAQVGADNAAKHEPRMSYIGGPDQATRCAETPPLSALDVNNLPSYAFIVPTLTHDTHDSSVATGDGWLKTELGAILGGQSFRNGDTLVELVHDEYTDIPNVVIGPTIVPGTRLGTPITHYNFLRLNEELLGLPLLGNASRAVSIRGPLHL